MGRRDLSTEHAEARTNHRNVCMGDQERLSKMREDAALQVHSEFQFACIAVYESDWIADTGVRKLTTAVSGRLRLTDTIFLAT